MYNFCRHIVYNSTGLLLTPQPSSYIAYAYTNAQSYAYAQSYACAQSDAYAQSDACEHAATGVARVYFSIVQEKAINAGAIFWVLIRWLYAMSRRNVCLYIRGAGPLLAASLPHCKSLIPL